MLNRRNFVAGTLGAGAVLATPGPHQAAAHCLNSKGTSCEPSRKRSRLRGTPGRDLVTARGREKAGCASSGLA
jgi:hypothetical protein